MITEVVKILVEEEHSSFSMQFKPCWIVVRVGSKMCFWLPGEFGIPECWWEKPLVVALKHSEGIKHTVLFQETKAYN
jgi:hypothetical protein